MALAKTCPASPGNYYRVGILQRALIFRLRVPESKIHVVPNGLSEQFAQLKQEPEVDAGLEGPFFLYVGSLEPRKNLGCLLKRGITQH